MSTLAKCAQSNSEGSCWCDDWSITLVGTRKGAGKENTGRKTPGEELWLTGAPWRPVSSPGHSQPAQPGHSCPTEVQATKRSGGPHLHTCGWWSFAHSDFQTIVRTGCRSPRLLPKFWPARYKQSCQAEAVQIGLCWNRTWSGRQ